MTARHGVGPMHDDLPSQRATNCKPRRNIAPIGGRSQPMTTMKNPLHIATVTSGQTARLAGTEMGDTM